MLCIFCPILFYELCLIEQNMFFSGICYGSDAEQGMCKKSTKDPIKDQLWVRGMFKGCAPVPSSSAAKVGLHVQTSLMKKEMQSGLILSLNIS